jgi:AcrR family transcriptional regulator
MVTDEAESMNRRDRLRVQAIADIEHASMSIIDSEGVHALSMAALAKAMRMSAPGLYRYFASRDALVAGMVTVAYGQLAEAVMQAGTAAGRRGPLARVRSMVAAYRGWALAHPRRYGMLFGERPAGITDTPESIAPMNSAMALFMAALQELQAAGGEPAGPDGALEGEFRRWMSTRDWTDAPLEASMAGVLIWTRVHGIVGLELAGVFESSVVSVAQLIDFEVDQAIGSVLQGGTGRGLHGRGSHVR